MKHITLFAGSNNPQSINQKLVTAISELLTETKNTVIDLKNYDMPMYSITLQHSEGAPKQALQLKQLIHTADLLIISVPEHNGSIPSFFKNTLDWLSRTGADYKAFSNKPGYTSKRLTRPWRCRCAGTYRIGNKPFRRPR